MGRLLLLALLCIVSYLALTPHPPKGMDTGWDKANHLLAFAALAFCGHWGWGTHLQRYVGVPAALLVFGGAIELLQLHVPGRSGEWADLFADSCGIVAGLLLAMLILRLLAALTPAKR
ncbi:VanZ family protein [Paucibacter sp. Y2R2-4]|uniref:VanZ family protein n=1 Tax=Paucibacter sp. Y2R2-4 TaxID=2893553 RepID=UPI0021E3A354|nr:VanZ family protein [Paucibacter sp. Y2R2-4]MCV2349147.1 VanZ family protein [Paucibacter sp. Y2R2-4]